MERVYRRRVTVALMAILGLIGLETPPAAADFPAVLELADLDGSDGFAIPGQVSLDRNGRSVSIVGDLNGDGFADLAVGAERASPDMINEAGEVYVIFGSPAPSGASFDVSTLDGSNGFIVEGLAGTDRAGTSVGGAGDLNGDGFGDLLIGAPLANPNGGNSGQVYVIFGSDAAFPSPFDLTTLDGTNGLTLNGPTGADRLGTSVSGAGDVDGDGIDDAILGAARAEPTNSGAAYLIYGSTDPFPATIEVSALDGTDGVTLEGAETQDRAGTSVGGAGDVNDDGFADLIIGAPRASRGMDNNIGEGYVVFGSDMLAATIDLGALDGTDGFILLGIDDDDRLGTRVQGAGDVNADGFEDVVIGAERANVGNNNEGEAYVIFGGSGPFPASIDLSTLDGTDGFVVQGIATGDRTGFSVAGIGDVDGDGRDDLLVGANRANPDGDVDRGEAYVVFGTDEGFPAALDASTLDGTNGLAVRGVAAGDRAGTSVGGVGDFNGDGLDDFMIGANLADPGGEATAGEAYLVFGERPAGCGRPAACGALRSVMLAPTLSPLELAEASNVEDEYLVGDWDGDGCDNIGVRRKNLILMDIDFDGRHDYEQRYGFGNDEDQYLIGDWNGDGCDEVAVRRDGNQLYIDTDFDGWHDFLFGYGGGANEDEYLAGDLDGDGIDEVAVRRGVEVIWNVFPWDGMGDGSTLFGGGNNDDDYFIGHFSDDFTTKDTIAVRRGNMLLYNFDFDTMHDLTQGYGGGANEDQYLVGDWDGDGIANIAVRRGNEILMDFDFDAMADMTQVFGGGTE